MSTLNLSAYQAVFDALRAIMDANENESWCEGRIPAGLLDQARSALLVAQFPVVQNTVKTCDFRTVSPVHTCDRPVEFLTSGGLHFCKDHADVMHDRFPAIRFSPVPVVPVNEDVETIRDAFEELEAGCTKFESSRHIKTGMAALDRLAAAAGKGTQ